MYELANISVKAIVRGPEGKYLLLQSKPRPYVTQDGVERNTAFWDLPGGRIDQFESLEDGLLREVREEIGLPITVAHQLTGELSPVRIVAENRNVAVIGFYFLCTTDQSEPHLSEEHTGFRWVTALEMADLLGPHFGSTLLEELRKLY